MNKILGNYKFLNRLFLLLLLTITTHADVKVSVSSPAVYTGEIVNFIISADGRDIQFPQISEIEGNAVIGTSSSQSIQIINTETTRTTAKTYSFRAEETLTIPSFTVTVDGTEIQTEEIEVKVVKPTASQNGSPFVIELILDKNESYVGEALDLSLVFKQKLNAHADKIQPSEPILENFWVKKVDKVEHGSEGDYTTQTIHYQLFPQKSGNFTIPAIETLIGKVDRRSNQRGGFFNDPFFNSMTQQINWQKIYSNELNLKVNALPNGLELYGNYQIQTFVDKTTIQANKAVNLTISIKGEGNIDDVKKFELDIPNVIVYADEPKISSQMVHNIYQGEFNQKIALIADHDFTVPALSLSYFDKATKTVKTVQSKPIDIKVTGGTEGSVKPSTIEVSPSQTIKASTPQKVETKVIIEKEDAYVKYLFLLLGLLLGAASMYGLNFLKTHERKKESSMIKAIKKAKDDKSLFNLLLPHSKEHSIISQALNSLEENLYRGGKNSIDKEALMDYFEELEE